MQSELKTYGLCCADHLPHGYRRALQKQRSCALTPGETLDVPGIYQVERGRRDQQLSRLEELERTLAGI